MQPRIMILTSLAFAGPRLRLALASSTTLLCSAAIVATFWFQDMRYSLPTPRPATLKQALPGTRARLPAALASLVREDRPLFLHFYRPECPCSRFNLDHVRSLERRRKDEATFVLVLEGPDRAALERAALRLDWPVPRVLDTAGEIAAALGVYSTPQAVIVDASGALAYRGNYNTTRYCTDARTEFARLALEDVIANRPVREFPAAATTAYGCSLPADLGDEAPCAPSRRAKLEACSRRPSSSPSKPIRPRRGAR
jgi:hypothetical protein